MIVRPPYGETLTGGRRTGSRVGRLVATCVMVVLTQSSPALSAEQVERGEYVFRAAGCAGCHTDTDREGAFLAGGRPLPTPFGTFYAPNITSDPDEGIGGWSADEFVRAMREGVSPDGEHYYPVFPYPSYTGMGVEDLVALYVYLQQVPAVAQPNRPHDLPWYMSYRIANRAWKLLFMEPGPFVPNPVRSPDWNRGAYLVTALTHCGECHTPRDRFGALDRDRWMAGAALGPGDDVAPNITPDTRDGIGNWKPSDLAEFLKSGRYYDGEFTEGPMAEVVDNGLSYLRTEDLEAISEYIFSLPPLPK